MEYKVEVVFEHHWGFRNLLFIKEFILPFTPFIGLSIIDESDDNDMRIDIVKHDYQDLMIDWMTSTNSFLITIRKNWGKFGVSPEHIKATIKHFESLNWNCESSEDDVKEMIEWSKEFSTIK